MGSPMQTERLLLRRFEASDAEAFAAYRSDPAVALYQGWETPFPLAAARNAVDDFAAADENAPGWFQWAIERAEQPGLIGDIGVNRGDDGRQAAIGYTLAPAHQGRGYAREALTRIIDRLLVEDGLHRVHAECDTRNTRSIRLLEHLGFRREGHLTASTWSNGAWSDDYLYAMLAREWKRERRDRP